MKPIKSVLTFLAFFAICAFVNAQTFDKLYEKYDKQEGITSVNISKDLFEMLSNLSDENKDTGSREMKKAMSQLTGLKVLTCKPDSVKPGKATALYNEASVLFTTPAYKELMTVNDGGENVRFLTKQDGKGKITEMVMVAKGKDEIVVMDLTGVIDLSTISKLSKTMNIHGMEHLKDMKEHKK
jgi:hypothetical protein